MFGHAVCFLWRCRKSWSYKKESERCLDMNLFRYRGSMIEYTLSIDCTRCGDGFT